MDKESSYARSNSRLYWTDEEIELLRLYGPTSSLEKIAKLLNRSADACKIKLNRLGIQRRLSAKAHGSAAESLRRIELLSDPLSEIEIRSAPEKLANTYWSDAETSLLIELAGTKNRSELALIFGRSKEAIKSRARTLGLSLSCNPLNNRLTSPPYFWTDEALQKLILGYATKSPILVAEELGIPYEKVSRKARDLGLKPLPIYLNKPIGRRVKSGRKGRYALTADGKIDERSLDDLDLMLVKLQPDFTNPQIGQLINKPAGWVSTRLSKIGMKRDLQQINKRRASNLGADLPPELRELNKLRTTLIRKLHAKSKDNRNTSRSFVQAN